MSHEQPATAAEILGTLYNRALQRYLEEIDFEARDHLTEEELLQWDAAWTLELGAPAPAQPRTIGKVVIEVLGGVAEVTSQPEGVDVEIIDHDNEEQDALGDWLDRKDMPQDGDGDGDE